MELVRVTKKLKDYKNIKKLYRKAFPAEERAPFRILIRNIKKPVTDFYGLYDDGKWVGLAYVIKNEKIAYLFYFAISKDCRGKGYGRKTMEALKECYKNQKFFLALEKLDESAPNYTQRVRRHNFYETCGLRDMPRKIREAKVTYDTMGIGQDVEPEEYNELIKEYLGKFYSKRVIMEMI